MVIRMNKCVLETSHDWTTAKMKDGPECTFAEDENDSDYVVLTNGLDECGMTLSFDNDTLTYSVSWRFRNFEDLRLNYGYINLQPFFIVIKSIAIFILKLIFRTLSKFHLQPSII